MNRRTPRRIRRLVTLLAMVVVALASVGGAAAPAGAVDHPGLVPDIPTSGYPVILHEMRHHREHVIKYNVRINFYIFMLNA